MFQVISCQAVAFEMEVMASSNTTKAKLNVTLTGQMKLIEPISVVIYLCSPA